MKFWSCGQASQFHFYHVSYLAFSIKCLNKWILNCESSSRHFQQDVEVLIGASEHCETTGYMKLRWQLSFHTSADVIFPVAGSGGPRKPISHGELYHTFCLASTWLQGTSILRQFLKLYTLFVYLQRHQTHLYLFPDITRSVREPVKKKHTSQK